MLTLISHAVYDYVCAVTKKMFEFATALNGNSCLLYVGWRDWATLDAWERGHVFLAAKACHPVSTRSSAGPLTRSAATANFAQSLPGFTGSGAAQVGARSDRTHPGEFCVAQHCPLSL